MLDFEPTSGATSTTSADCVLAHLREHHLQLQWILETLVHTDHLSAAHYLRAQADGRITTGEHVRQVQTTFARLYNLNVETPAAGGSFDHLFHDGATFSIGSLQATAWWVPGHTPADLACLVEDAVFVGDTPFIPDVGSACADSLGGAARARRERRGLPEAATQCLAPGRPRLERLKQPAVQARPVAAATAAGA